MDTTTLLWALAVLLIVVGMAGTVLPILPGIPLVFGGMLLAAYADGFHRVGTITLVVLGILTLIAMAIDYFAATLGAKRLGASREAMIGATIGTIAGIWFGLVGLLLGPFVGAVTGELIARRDMSQASKVGLGTWVGLLVGAALKVAIGFTMVGVFITSYWLGK